jgi:hypothetical protein
MSAHPFPTWDENDKKSMALPLLQQRFWTFCVSGAAPNERQLLLTFYDSFIVHCWYRSQCDDSPTGLDTSAELFPAVQADDAILGSAHTKAMAGLHP